MESGIDLQSSEEVVDRVSSKDDADKRDPETSKAGVCRQIRKSLQDSMMEEGLTPCL